MMQRCPECWYIHSGIKYIIRSGLSSQHTKRIITRVGMSLIFAVRHIGCLLDLPIYVAWLCNCMLFGCCDMAGARTTHMQCFFLAFSVNREMKQHKIIIVLFYSVCLLLGKQKCGNIPIDVRPLLLFILVVVVLIVIFVELFFSGRWQNSQRGFVRRFARQQGQPGRFVRWQESHCVRCSRSFYARMLEGNSSLWPRTHPDQINFEY